MLRYVTLCNDMYLPYGDYFLNYHNNYILLNLAYSNKKKTNKSVTEFIKPLVKSVNYITQRTKLSFKLKSRNIYILGSSSEHQDESAKLTKNSVPNLRP